MSNLEKLDIKALTKEAEDGNGCAIKDAIGKMFWEERLAAIKAIEAQNKENRENNPSLPEIITHGYGSNRRGQPGGMDVHKGRGWVGHGPTIYEEVINFSNGTFTATCEKPPRKR